MGRRVERRARRRGLQLTHPAEGIALSVAGALVIATLWSSYQNVEESAVTINPTVTSQPTSAEPLGRQDAASYPSALLRPVPEESTVGQGVRKKPTADEQPAESVPSTSSEPTASPSPEPSSETSSPTKPPVTTPPPVEPVEPPTTPTTPTTPTPDTSAPPVTPPPATPTPEPPDDGTTPTSEPTGTGTPSTPGVTAPTSGPTTKTSTTKTSTTKTATTKVATVPDRD